jgi:cell wall-associated NlpC family hydrolase
MTITDSVSRIQQIQSTLTLLSTSPARSVQSTSAPVAAAGSATAANSTTTQATSTRPPAAAQAAPDSASLFAEALSDAVVPAPEVETMAPVAAPAPVPAPSSGEAARLIEAARQYEGVPYVWGGTDPAVGLDCSGFVQRAYSDIGIQIPRVTWDQMNAGTHVPSLAEAQPGDLLFSHDGGHVSMYLGGGKAIDAPQPGQTVAVRDMWETDGNITTIRRILPTEPQGAASIDPATLGTPAADPAANDAYAAQAAFLAGMAR